MLVEKSRILNLCIKRKILNVELIHNHLAKNEKPGVKSGITGNKLQK